MITIKKNWSACDKSLVRKIIREVLDNLEEYDADSFATTESFLITFDSEDIKQLKSLL